MARIAIVGAGIGGLFAGNILAGKGHKVTIFEAHSSPGGYTGGFWRDGFYFESGTVSFESSDVILKAMKDVGLEGRVEFVRQPSRFVSSRFDCIPASWDEFIQALLAAYPEQADDLRQCNAEIVRMVTIMRRLSQPRDLLGAIALPFQLLGALPVLKKYDAMTLTEFLKQYFDRGTHLYQVLAESGYPNMRAVILAGAALALFEDYWTVKGGMQSWANVLAENFRSLGGELRLNAKVDRILTLNRCAVGVRCGTEEFAADYVLTASDYKRTFLQLVDDRSLLPDEFARRVQQATVSEPFFVVYLGLDMPLDRLREMMKVAHVSYCAGIGADLADAEDESFFGKTSIMLYSPSMQNPDLAPQGKSSLMLSTIVPPRWMNNWGGGNKEVYRQLKDKAMRALIEEASFVVGDLKQHILYQDAASPLTYERYTRNTDGASSAWSWHPRKRFYKSLMSVKVDTPIQNLLVSSCWASQIGGVPTAIQAAYACAKKIK